MFMKCRWFVAALVLVVVQQASLAVSTYFIAMAGESLSSDGYERLRLFISLFFCFALLAYFLSSCSEFCLVKLRNELWEKYVLQSFETIREDAGASSGKNRQMLNNWLVGEAPSTIGTAGEFYVGMASVYCNILMTLGVFYLTLGGWMSTAIVASLGFSLVSVWRLKGRIDNLADSMQSSRLQALVKVAPLWDHAFFAPERMHKEANARFRERARSYFHVTERYLLLEQVVACLPIYLAVGMVLGAMYVLPPQAQVPLGVLVAVLPRTLQLFGNVHALSMYSSRLILVRKQVRNLIEFTAGLDRQDLRGQISSGSMTLIDVQSKKSFQPMEFLAAVKSREIRSGRYRLTGRNGAGKSSFLKILRFENRNSLLLSPEVDFVGHEEAASSGELQCRQISMLLQQDVNLLLLDEWDANLDDANFNLIDAEISASAAHRLIVEVRHRVDRAFVA